MHLRNDVAIIHSDLGNALKRVGDLKGVILEYRAAVYLKPNYSLFHLDLAEALMQKDDPAEAIDEYRAWLSLYPDDYRTHIKLVRAVWMAGDHNAAFTEYIAVRRRWPKSTIPSIWLGPPELRFEFGEIFWNKGLKTEAIYEFKEYLAWALDIPKNRESLKHAQARLREFGQ